MNRLLAVLLLVSLGGCAQLRPQPEALEQEIEALAADGEFGEALTQVEIRIGEAPQDPRWAKQRESILTRAAQFERDRMQQARELIRGERWQEVEQLFDDALALYPQSKRLNKARNDFISRRREEMEEISQQLLLLRGEWLSRSAPLYDLIESQGPTASWRETISDFHQDRRATAAELNRCGQKALQRGSLDLATHCLALSASLDPNDAVRGALETARKRQEGERSRDAAARQQREQQDSARRNAEMAAECRKALAGKDLSKANECLRRLDEVAPYSAEVAELRPLIDAAVDDHVRRGIDEGQQRYSNGQIEQALEVWEPLLELRPDNLELQTHVERARRVLRKLRQLGG